jgi:hypothetical protein
MLTKPTNPLIDASPAQTLQRARITLDWLAHIEEPFADEELSQGHGFVDEMIRDAIEYEEQRASAVRAGASGGAVMNAALADPFAQILAQARAFAHNENHIAALSPAERIAVALVLDRPDLIEDGTLLESIERLGPEWTRGALDVQRSGVTCEELAHG